MCTAGDSAEDTHECENSIEYKGYGISKMLFESTGTTASVCDCSEKRAALDLQDAFKHTSGHDVQDLHAKSIRILLVNDAYRTKRLGTSILADTQRIFDNATQIFDEQDWGEYKINLKLSNVLNIEWAPSVSMDCQWSADVSSDSLDIEQNPVLESTASVSTNSKKRYVSSLARFATMFGEIIGYAHANGILHKAPDVVFLVSEDINEDVEGLSYNSCAFHKNRCFGMVFVDDTSDHYSHGRALAHEICHTLGAEHDARRGYLMSGISGLEEKGRAAQISDETRHAVISFLRHKDVAA